MPHMGRSVIFYNNLGYDEFKKLLGNELKKMENNNMQYVIFENRNLLIPRMSTNGKMINGVDNIKSELKTILA